MRAQFYFSVNGARAGLRTYFGFTKTVKEGNIQTKQQHGSCRALQMKCSFIVCLLVQLVSPRKTRLWWPGFFYSSRKCLNSLNFVFFFIYKLNQRTSVSCVIDLTVFLYIKLQLSTYSKSLQHRLMFFFLSCNILPFLQSWNSYVRKEFIKSDPQ